MSAWQRLGFAMLVLGVVACGDMGDEPVPPDPPPPNPPSNLENGPGAFALDYKTSGDFVTQMTEVRNPTTPEVPTTGPHNNVLIWYSTNIESLLNTTDFVVPEGTVSIKERYVSDTTTLTEYEVMIKLAEGTSPDSNDWLYEAYTPDGVKKEGSTQTTGFCNNCHEGVPKTDYLFGVSLK